MYEQSTRVELRKEERIKEKKRIVLKMIKGISLLISISVELYVLRKITNEWYGLAIGIWGAIMVPRLIDAIIKYYKKEDRL
jgi:uncharacterized membrane protein YcjF (UPF0283 family)